MTMTVVSESFPVRALTLPPPPKRYSSKDQAETRRMIEQALTALMTALGKGAP